SCPAGGCGPVACFLLGLIVASPLYARLTWGNAIQGRFSLRSAASFTFFEPSLLSFDFSMTRPSLHLFRILNQGISTAL
ncbi:MAG: hypothetical protein SO121_04295, partial [Eggerthellaceae bacterium]|nr:hypothetical protein [Eggerthellaceae bacterium]